MTQRTTYFVDVVLPVPIAQAFTYRVPVELNEQVCFGIRVIVPFGKNKRLTKGKKGGKKKIIDSMSRKEWFDFKAPAPFDSKPFGKTCITKTTGTRIATELIKGRVVEVSLADLKNNSDNLAWRKVKLQVEDVEGRFCRTSFYGMNITRDQLCKFIRKW